MHADILVVTVTRVEAKAVLEIFQQATGKAARRREIDRKIYRDLGTLNGMRIFMVRSEMGAGGLGAAQQSVSKGIGALSPVAVVMVGIAFGIDRNKQSIGDVLVSQRLSLYDYQKIQTTPKGEPRIIPRGDRVTASTRLLDWFRSADEVADSSFKVRFGLVLSGEKLIDNFDFRQQIAQMEPEAIGGEMEGAGLYAASVDAGVEWILAKGICDWADGKKEEDKEQRQEAAATNAARFLLHVLNHANYEMSVSKRTHAQRMNSTEPSAKGKPCKPKSYNPPLVMSLHGIRTRGEWQKVLASVLSGSPVKSDQISDSDIVPFLSSGTLKIYLMSIAIWEKYRRWGDGILQQAYVQLLTGFLDKLVFYAKNHQIKVSHLLATAWTSEGRKMCEFFGMTEIGKDKFGDPIFELDLNSLETRSLRGVSPAVRHLVKVYRTL